MQKDASIQNFWKEIRNLSYSSAVWNYKYNNFIEIGIKYNLLTKCCNQVYDLLDYKFCPKCGKNFKKVKV